MTIWQQIKKWFSELFYRPSSDKEEGPVDDFDYYYGKISSYNGTRCPFNPDSTYGEKTVCSFWLRKDRTIVIQNTVYNVVSIEESPTLYRIFFSEESDDSYNSTSTYMTSVYRRTPARKYIGWVQIEKAKN